uniref:Uncharacterized protein n=1 Tax=Rhinopithecus roxellana TaxID=61622 RepID=A0A2K6NU50_RHIRO
MRSVRHHHFSRQGLISQHIFKIQLISAVLVLQLEFNLKNWMNVYMATTSLISCIKKCTHHTSKSQKLCQVLHIRIALPYLVKIFY